MLKKRGQGFSMESFLGWILFGTALLIIILLSIFVLSGKASGAIDFLKNVLGFK